MDRIPFSKSLATHCSFADQEISEEAGTKLEVFWEVGFHKISPIHLVDFSEQQLPSLETYEEVYLAFWIAEQ